MELNEFAIVDLFLFVESVMVVSVLMKHDGVVDIHNKGVDKGLYNNSLNIEVDGTVKTNVAENIVDNFENFVDTGDANKVEKMYWETLPLFLIMVLLFIYKNYTNNYKGY